MGRLTWLADRIIAPLIVSLLTPLVIGAFSQYSTGDWLKLINRIPVIYWELFFAMMFLWGVGILVRRRQLKVADLNKPIVIFSKQQPLFGWIDIGERGHAGLIWRVQIPNNGPSPLVNRRISSEAEVELPPRCPHCKTQIEESFSFWGGVKWKCPRSDFHKRNKEPYIQEAERVTKLARRELE